MHNGVRLASIAKEVNLTPVKLEAEVCGGGRLHGGVLADGSYGHYVRQSDRSAAHDRYDIKITIRATCNALPEPKKANKEQAAPWT